MFIVEATKGQEVIETVTRAVAERGVTNAALTVIGATADARVSVMPADDESKDLVTDYPFPLEITGTGEVRNGTVHVHVSGGGENGPVIGHLHRAIVGGWFVHVYVSPLSE